MTIRSINTSGLPQGVLTPMGDLLFAASEPGAWYDPSDMSTMFQDSAGTTPVTAVEQPVGLMLDKSGRGNHASQATSTKRPKYSRRVNLLLNTENPSAWPTSGITGTAEAGGVSLLQSTADGSLMYPSSLYPIGWTAISNSCIYRSIEYLPGDALYVAYGPAAGSSFVTVRTSDGVVVGAVGGASPLRKITPLSDGWVRVETWDSLASHGASQLSSILYFGNTFTYPYITTTSRAGTQIRVRQLQYVVLPFGSTHSVPYQSVNTDTDYDADPAKFPGYLSFDGVDDALQTGNIDFTGTDKMTVWAGVGTDISGATGYLLNQNFTGVNSFRLGVPAPAGAINSVVVENSPYFVSVSKSGLAGNLRSVISASHRSGEHLLRLDGMLVGSETNATTGPYGGNSSLYIGALGTGSSFFNGRIYNLIVRGAQSSQSQIEACELYVKQKMRLP